MLQLSKLKREKKFEAHEFLYIKFLSMVFFYIILCLLYLMAKKLEQMNGKHNMLKFFMGINGLYRHSEWDIFKFIIFMESHLILYV